MICDTFAHKEKLVALKRKVKSKQRRLCGGRRKAMDEDMELNTLLGQIQDLCRNACHVSFCDRGLGSCLRMTALAVGFS
jgi:hypothetical protein